jgi:SAM-dependent methyltransferase
MKQPNEQRLSYPGRDLEAMAFAKNYHRWIMEIFQPYFGRSVAEIGAGAGSVSEFLLERVEGELILVEPSLEMFPLLERRFGAIDNVELHQDFFSNIADKISPDTLVYVNVMEHIPDDKAEIEAAYRSLQPGGHLLIFVPALPSIYSALDKALDHFRRYRLRPLKKLCADAGFDIVRARYFDLLGIFPWWFSFKLLRSTKISPRSVHLYDRLVVPVEKRLETLIRPPIGKNILLVARKAG